MKEKGKNNTKLRLALCPNAAAPHGSGIQNSGDTAAAWLLLVPWELGGGATWRQDQISKEAALVSWC